VSSTWAGARLRPVQPPLHSLLSSLTSGTRPDKHAQAFPLGRADRREDGAFCYSLYITRLRLRRTPCEVPPSRHQRHRELHMGRCSAKAGPATAGFFCSSLTSGKIRISTQAFDLIRFPDRRGRQLCCIRGLLTAAGKSDNLTYLQKHGVSSVWAPMLLRCPPWSRGDSDTFSRQTPMRFSQSQSKPRHG
jgi:hypothetical protein